MEYIYTFQFVMMEGAPEVCVGGKPFSPSNESCVCFQTYLKRASAKKFPVTVLQGLVETPFQITELCPLHSSCKQISGKTFYLNA
jgi:hypothetical protein